MFGSLNNKEFRRIHGEVMLTVRALRALRAARLICYAGYYDATLESVIFSSAFRCGRTNSRINSGTLALRTPEPIIYQLTWICYNCGV